MGILVRQSIISTIISYIGIGIGYVNLLYLYPRFLSPEQVGLMRAVQDASILLAQFAQFGLAQSIIRFFPRFMNEVARSKSFINTILLASLVAFGFFLIIFFAFQEPIMGYFEMNAHELIRYSSLVLWLTFITVATTLMEVYSRSLLKNILPNLVREVIARLMLAVLVLLYFKGILNFEEVMIGSVLIYLTCLLIIVIYLAAGNHLHFRVDFAIFDRNLRKEITLFSILSFAGTAGLIVIAKVDSLMVAGLLGLAPVAVYTTSSYMATVIEVPKRAMTQVATPLIARGFEKNNHEEIRSIYHKTALNQFILGALLLIGIFANIDSIFMLMPKGEIYQAGKWVVIIVGAGKLVDMLFGPSSEIIIYSKYYSFNIVLILLLCAVIITSNNLLIPRYGIEGAAIGTAITMIIFNSVKFVFIWARMRLQPFSSAFLKVLVIGGATLAVNMIVPRLDFVIADMIVRSGIISAVFGGLVLLSKASPDGNRLVKDLVTAIKR
jgi:O-antigen/teichoic acid export membrane protein